MSRRGGTRHSPPISLPRVFFLHGYPEPHPSHAELASRLGVIATAPVAPRNTRGMVAAFHQARVLSLNKDWDALLAEWPCSEVVFLRLLDRQHRRLVRLDSSNSCIRIGSHRLLGRWLRRLELRAWDGLIVLNEEAERAVRTLVSPNTDVVRWTPSITSGDPFGEIVSDQKGPVISLMHGGPRYRTHSKGIDRVAAVSNLGKHEGRGPVTVYGGWKKQQKAPFQDAVVFGGVRPSQEALRGASILLHLSRIDAFPVAIVEAMMAGVPPIVARAGSAVLVKNVEPRLLVEDEGSAVEAVRWILALPAYEYHELCGRLREEALRYVDSTQRPEHIAGVQWALNCSEPVLRGVWRPVPLQSRVPRRPETAHRLAGPGEASADVPIRAPSQQTPLSTREA